MKKKWCGRGDLNPHTRRALPPQGSVSTVSPRPHIREKEEEALKRPQLIIKMDLRKERSKR